MRENVAKNGIPTVEDFRIKAEKLAAGSIVCILPKSKIWMVKMRLDSRRYWLLRKNWDFNMFLSQPTDGRFYDIEFYGWTKDLAWDFLEKLESLSFDLKAI